MPTDEIVCVSEIRLISIYALSSSHCWRIIVIRCVFSCICRIPYSCVFVIWIWSWHLLTYLIASLRNYSAWTSLSFCIMNLNVSFVRMFLNIVLFITTHYSRIRFYFRWLMNYTIILALIYVIWWIQCSLNASIV